jgi:5-(carboxyamino)imidazole ribonucleotide mutase
MPDGAGRTPVPRVGLIMGSQSDWVTLHHSADILERLGIGHETRIVSAHRTPERLYAYAREARGRGLRVIIAGAGGAAHLPGMVAALTPLPVLGVPIRTEALSGLDSLLSIVQMPAGVPVGTLAIGRAGAVNAALLAAAIIGLDEPAVAQSLDDFRKRQTDAVADSPSDHPGSSSASRDSPPVDDQGSSSAARDSPPTTDPGSSSAARGSPPINDPGSSSAKRGSPPTSDPGSSSAKRGSPQTGAG